MKGMTMDNKVLPTRKVSPPIGPMDESRNVTTRVPPQEPPSHRQQGEVSPFQPNTDRSI
jgi:hypothetical protein